MAKNKNDIGNGILSALAIIGGALLSVEILKSLSKKETVYDCPVCKYDVKYGTLECPNCHSKLSWPTKEAYNG